MTKAWGWAFLAVSLSVAFAFWRAVVADPVTTALENKLIDLRFQARGAETAPGDVVLIGVDADAVDRLGWSPPPRGAIAEAIVALSEAGVSAIAIDMLFLEDGSDDGVLASSIEGSGSVTLALAAVHEGGRPEAVSSPALLKNVISVVIGPQPEGQSPRLHLPNATLIDAGTLGHVNFSQGADRVARHVPLTIWVGDGLHLPAMAVSAAAAHLGTARGRIRLETGKRLVVGDTTFPTDRLGRLPISHYGPEATIPTVGLLDVLDGRAPAEALKGRVAIIGVTDKSFSDVFATPFGSSIPGAELIATVTQNLISGHVLTQGGEARTIGVIAAPVVAIALVIAAFAPLPALWVAAIWALALGGLQFAFERAGLLVDATSLAGALLFGSFATLRIRSARNRARRQILEQERGNLSRFVSPALADQLASRGAPGFDTREQEAAVLFADVEGYTTIAERLSPVDAAAFVGGLHKVFEQCAETHGGVIISFEGDGVMVGFGLPEPSADDAVRALDCGAAMIHAVGQLEKPGQPNATLRLRVGVNHGPVVAAVVGGDRQAHVTLSGDTVNVAARLQEIAKAQGVRFAAARAALDAAEAATGMRTDGWSLLVRTAVRGRQEEIEVWSPD